jgi:hypothetical protein
MLLHSLKSTSSISSPLVPRHPSSFRYAQSGDSLPDNALMSCMKYSETVQYHLEDDIDIRSEPTQYGDYHFCR